MLALPSDSVAPPDLASLQGLSSREHPGPSGYSSNRTLPAVLTISVPVPLALRPSGDAVCA